MLENKCQAGGSGDWFFGLKEILGFVDAVYPTQESIPTYDELCKGTLI